ncbi:AAA domain-containing protein [Cubamyces lactineus]|nr:AAA domain-containing protein [Cubamyces lactineus]
MSFDFATEYRYGAVFVLGPSSSGKTTLCDTLSEELGVRPPQYIKEVARNVMKTHGFTRNDTDTYEMQYAIMAAQLEAEERAAAALQNTTVAGIRLILSDRSAIDPIVYAGTSGVPGALGRRHRLLEDAALQRMLPSYRGSLFVVLEPVTEWLEDDGVRSLEDPGRYNSVLVATLRELGIPYVTIGTETKDIRARVNLVLEHLLDVAALSSRVLTGGK